MFFLFSKILTILLFPLPLCILTGFFFSIFLIKGTRNKILSIAPILLLTFFSIPYTSQILIRSLEDEFPAVDFQKIEKADAIVVLGGMINPLSIHREKPELLSTADRLTDSIIMFRQKKAPYILFSGGSGILFQGDVSEAKTAKKFLTDMGIPEDQILLEDKSRNTKENAVFSAGILREKKIKKIILVTSAFHMKRSLLVFEKEGFEIQIFPTDYKSLYWSWNWDTAVPSIGALDTSTISIKEWIGLISYQIAESI